MKAKIDKLEKCVRLFGHKVLALHRSMIGNICVKDLTLGKWRYLTNDEIKEMGVER